MDTVRKAISHRECDIIVIGNSWQVPEDKRQADSDGDGNAHNNSGDEGATRNWHFHCGVLCSRYI
jgi:hypothetical protein